MQGTTETTYPAGATTQSKKSSANTHQAQTAPMTAHILDDQDDQSMRMCAVLLQSAVTILITMLHTHDTVLGGQDNPRKDVSHESVYDEKQHLT